LAKLDLKNKKELEELEQQYQNRINANAKRNKNSKRNRYNQKRK
jgi:hypothetical protein